MTTVALDLLMYLYLQARRATRQEWIGTHELHRNSSTRYSVETWYYARINLLYITAAPACSYHRVSDFGDASFRQTACDCINQRISAGADAVLKEHIPR
jgi:hypothetical protein